MTTTSREAISVFLGYVESIPSDESGEANTTMGPTTKGRNATVTGGGEDNSAGGGETFSICEEYSTEFSGSMYLVLLEFSQKSSFQCKIPFFPKKFSHLTSKHCGNSTCTEIQQVPG